jgi:putative flippase GtrA
MTTARKQWLSRLFRDKTDSTLIQLFRYGFVGGMAFLVDYGTLYVLTEFLGLHYLLSATIAFVIGLVTNYLLSIAWVFNSRKSGSRWVEFTVFALIGIIGLGLNALVMYLCTDFLGMHYLISKLVSTAIVFFWNFFARKTILFKTTER